MLQFFFSSAAKKIKYWDKKFEEEMCFCICESLGPYILKMAVNWIATFPEWLESGSCEPVRRKIVFRLAPTLGSIKSSFTFQHTDKRPRIFTYAITRGKLIRMKSQKIKSANILSQHSYSCDWWKKFESFKFLKTDQSQQLWELISRFLLFLVKFSESGTVRNISIKNQQDFLEKGLILLFTAQ